MKSLGYILDVEGDLNFSSSIISEYSYRKELFDSSQFIHRCGTCFVQITAEEDGFLFLKNRLYLSHHRQGGRSASTSSAHAGANDPAELKKQLQEICEDQDELNTRWEEILRSLSGLVEERTQDEEEKTEMAPSSYVPSEKGTIPRTATIPAEYPLPSSLAESLPALSQSPEEAD